MAEYRFEPDEECTNCVEKKTAIAHCNTCQRLLCEECLRQHKRQRDTTDHNVVQSDAAIELKKKSLCPQHEKEVTLYCCDCIKPICFDCSMTTCSTHKKNAAKDVRDLLEQKLTIVKEKAIEFESHFEHIMSVEQKNITEVARCEADIDQLFQEVIEQLEEKKKQLFNNLHRANDTQQEYISQHKDSVKRKLDELKENIKATMDLLKSRQESKLMLVRDEHLAKMEELGQFDWSTEHVNPTQWQIRTPPNNNYLNKFGEILPKVEPRNITVDLKDRALVGSNNSFTINVKPLEQIQKCDIDKEVSVKIILIPGTVGGTSSRAQGTLLHRKLSKLSENVWSVSFFPRSCGTLSISVSVCGIEAEGSCFDMPVEDGIKKGDKVVRGMDWKWEDQDGRHGNTGEVTEVKGNGWISVKWSGSKGKPHDYRWGKDGKFDVKIQGP